MGVSEWVIVLLVIYVLICEVIAWIDRGVLRDYKEAVGLDANAPDEQFQYRLFDLRRNEAGKGPGEFTCTVEVHLMEDE